MALFFRGDQKMIQSKPCRKQDLVPLVVFSLLFWAFCFACSPKVIQGRSAQSDPITSGPGRFPSAHGDSGGTGGLDDEIHWTPGQVFFEKTLKPIFEVECISCHVAPRLVTGTPAPTTIYAYDRMKPYLQNGPGAGSNLLIDIARNVAPHTGGDRCLLGLTAQPCSQMIQWWSIENERSSEVIVGGFLFDRSREQIHIWAGDVQNPNQSLTIEILMNGPRGIGTSLGPMTANEFSVLSRVPGNHGLSLPLPDGFNGNGDTHSVYLYAQDQSFNWILTGGSPWQYSNYQMSAAGRDFFQNQISPRVDSCRSCHSVSADSFYEYLLQPAPNGGGTATNNLLIGKARGSFNGLGHGGGNLCGGINGSPCGEFQAWWNMEFN